MQARGARTGVGSKEETNLENHIVSHASGVSPGFLSGRSWKLRALRDDAHLINIHVRKLVIGGPQEPQEPQSELDYASQRRTWEKNWPLLHVQAEANATR
ncbi:hypothetical protein F9C07_4774 [Aspergillus flavus]|uniref:Uncharacterized protein n=1 Tax=Aspergillus flavus (strain ATCC 200026 / FGSC A1120 / IAM 13836 / NRRL 3357 / JCM 12722 / SRRC 167) TaxID=332952 RepID=A0A7U2QWU2_ASPFN|nr:hypothetical protein AFLA70_141g002380 [Aspergillus flavus AF70]QRD85750.1 hypothetical protein F9C07_4774 [Aspergillus flavus]